VNAPVYANYGNGYYTSTTSMAVVNPLPVSMRVVPTSVDYSSLATQDFTAAVIAVSSLTLTTSQSNLSTGTIDGNCTGATNARGCKLLNNNNAAGYLGFSAEL
jgi:hypothetical protein